MGSAGTSETERVAIARRSLFRGGWPQATVGALVTALCVGALGQSVAFVAFLADAFPGASAAQAARYGGALFYVFHHVGMAVHSPDLHLADDADRVLGWPSGRAVDAVIAFAFLSGTAVVMGLLIRAGRSAGQAVGGPELRRVIHGAKVAVPYALLSWSASWALSFQVSIPDSSPMSAHPSHIASFLWPLALGAVFGGVGGIRSAGDGMWTSPWLWATEAWPRRWRGALAGGMWMLGLGLVLSLAGLGVAAASEPSIAASYAGTVFRPGVGTGLMAVLLALLALPNVAAWILVPAMGGCLEVGGGAGTSLPSFCFLSYESFFDRPLPGTFNHFWGYPELGQPPRAWLLFLLVPLVAVMVSGALAARRAEARGRWEGLLVGGLAGGVFAVLLTGVLILAAVTARFEGPLTDVATGYFRYGPYPPYGFELALGWGTLGGATGGFLRAVMSGGATRFARRPAPS